MARLLTVALVLFVLVTGCSTPGIRVTREEFGDRWPFTVASGTLRCDTDGARKHVTLDTGDGIMYALNGSARDFGYPDSKSIQKPGTVGVNLQPFIERGLTLCR